MFHINESCLTWISHVSSEPVMSYMHVAVARPGFGCCHEQITWLERRDRDVPYQWVCLTWMSHVIWISRGMYKCRSTYELARMNESCHIWMIHVTYEWGMSHMNESCHVWMRHVSHEWVMSRMNEACLTWMSHVTWISRGTHDSVMAHINE